MKITYVRTAVIEANYVGRLGGSFVTLPWGGICHGC
jgi:hypothetical protein